MNNYLAAAILPVHSYARTFLILTPIFIAALYIQTKYEATLNDSMYPYLPESLQNEYRLNSDEWMGTYLYRNFTVCCMVMFQ
jgi:hypothetical protein